MAALLPLQVSVEEAFGQFAEGIPFHTVLEDRNLISVELYVPVEIDRQKPHDREELYIVAQGQGTFSRGGETVDFGPGDLLHVPAHIEHRFETFSDDFRVWVIFYGPQVPKP